MNNVADQDLLPDGVHNLLCFFSWTSLKKSGPGDAVIEPPLRRHACVKRGRWSYAYVLIGSTLSNLHQSSHISRTITCVFQTCVYRYSFLLLIIIKYQTWSIISMSFVRYFLRSKYVKGVVFWVNDAWKSQEIFKCLLVSPSWCWPNHKINGCFQNPKTSENCVKYQLIPVPQKVFEINSSNGTGFKFGGVYSSKCQPT